jgi:hypothetical protein
MFENERFSLLSRRNRASSPFTKRARRHLILRMGGKISSSVKAMRVQGLTESLCIVLLLLNCGASLRWRSQGRINSIAFATLFWSTALGPTVPAGKASTIFFVKNGYKVSTRCKSRRRPLRKMWLARGRLDSTRRTVHSFRSQLGEP